MKKRYFICFAAIITVLAVAIIFILYKRENRELLLEDLWKNKEITEVAFVEETKKKWPPFLRISEAKRYNASVKTIILQDGPTGCACTMKRGNR